MSLDIIEELFEAFRQADPERVAALFHEEARHRVYSMGSAMPLGSVVEGREAIARHYHALWQRWRLVRVEVDEPVVDGDRVAVRTTVDAVDAAEERPFRTEVMHFLTIVENRILEFDVFLENVSARLMHRDD